jgi:2-O-methyltransferase
MRAAKWLALTESVAVAKPASSLLPTAMRCNLGANRGRPLKSQIDQVRQEPLAFSEIRDLVGRDDPLILEMGANNGNHSLRFLRTFPLCRLFCFEPDLRAIRMWRERVRDPRAVLIEAAVGAVDAPVTFHVSGGVEEKHPEGWDKSGSIRAPKKHLESHPRITFAHQVTIQCIRLDTWHEAAGRPEIDFIWADVQGAEIDLISGGANALAKCRYFYTEYSQREMYDGQIDLQQICALLSSFDLVYRFKSDALFRRSNADGHRRVTRTWFGKWLPEGLSGRARPFRRKR